MQDRYLYRAKRMDNGEWVKGSLVWSDDADDDYKAIIIPTIDSNMFTIGGANGDLGFENWYRVDQSTICACTGLKDKNGKLIWENDVVHIPYRNLEDSVCKVIYQKGYFVGELADGSLDCIVRSDVEVIGNIFDNPELLEVGV